MKSLVGITSILMLLLAGGCSTSPSDPVTQRTPHPFCALPNDMAKRLDQALAEEYQQGTFSGTVLISRQQQQVLDCSYGEADKKGQQLNNDQTLSDIGSIAKTFTAAAVLLLQAEGQLQLSDSVGHFYADAPTDKQDISILQLLTHQSGLDNFHNNSDFEAISREQAEQRILAMPLISPPGSDIAYSNAAYTLLAAIVERVSGQTFEQFVQQRLLSPLALRSTGFYTDPRLNSQPIAKGYGGQHSGERTYDKPLTWALKGAGGMLSTSKDLQRWFRALQDSEQLPAALRHQVFLPANKKWTLGNWAISGANGMSIWQMGGSTDFGYTALVQYVPERDLLIVLTLNSYSDKYANATHHRISRNLLLPLLL
ncbi:serine hydrolase domain-containing protein [Bowmanella denitrificans]|uniref:serine hydrolase domain-containing protein n=1 Tax=Bowmanella denitrificans TaxID=366582 RepID=UPI000C9C52D5|nr:serine hydrolase domain-containing protein [Bowmanella denitrificans]